MDLNSWIHILVGAISFLITHSNPNSPQARIPTRNPLRFNGPNARLDCAPANAADDECDLRRQVQARGILFEGCGLALMCLS